MVQRLLGLVIGGWLGCGCLLSNPPDYDDPVEYRPAIVLRSPSSQIIEIQVDEPEVYEKNFYLQVWDGNVEQTLRYRWFLNYHPDAVPRCNLASEYPAPNNGGEVREVEYSLPYKVLAAGACHRLSAVITDGEWFDGPRRGCAKVAEGANRLVADWWILASDESTPADDVRFRACMALAEFDP